MLQYLLKKTQILYTVLGTRKSWEFIEAHPTSTSSLHYLYICHIESLYEIKHRACHACWENIFCEWRELLGWYADSEFFFPFTTAALTSSLDTFRSSSEKSILSRIVFGIIVSEMEKNFLFEWMIDKTSSPEWLWIFEIHRHGLYRKTREDKKKSNSQKLTGTTAKNLYNHSLCSSSILHTSQQVINQRRYARS